ncbi:helix-turn-helix transcriptional regulator [Actinoplanes bogorensis]|uniref:Helix-turn-helix transcriptional regulator n=1 Tax=Paractinoplanes bogorensis TaxID=1610840 RepID=A0ABS5Z0X0_9ACTN|nr:helix-turn-helix transcriptional regulator [Actinoplanes bogorensis]MBU2669340.1 helix-turn-helix transcriptional regulator [Actinoplanes bogorensis]
MHREALGQYLRSRRELASSAGTGSPVDGRRTPGLRRSEVAVRANISTIHYTNIEQARGARPSADVLAAICRALQLTEAETRHVFDLAEQAPPRPAHPAMDLSDRNRRLLEGIGPVPAMVCSARLDVIGQNQAAIDLLGDFSTASATQRNLARRHFLGADDGTFWGTAGMGRFARFAAARLRSAATHYPDDAETRELIDDLCDRSPSFAQIWSQGPVGFTADGRSDANQVTIGAATMACDVTVFPDQDQYLVLLTPGDDRA